MLLVVLAPLVWGATGLMVTPVLSAGEPGHAHVERIIHRCSWKASRLVIGGLL
jgi:hypothetical protein